MATSNTCESRLAFGELGASGISPAGLEQYKLDRLLELRALIDSLRCDRSQELLDDALAERGSRYHP